MKICCPLNQTSCSDSHHCISGELYSTTLFYLAIACCRMFHFVLYCQAVKILHLPFVIFNHRRLQFDLQIIYVCQSVINELNTSVFRFSVVRCAELTLLCWPLYSTGKTCWGDKAISGAGPVNSQKSQQILVTDDNPAPQAGLHCGAMR